MWINLPQLEEGKVRLGGRRNIHSSDETVRQRLEWQPKGGSKSSDIVPIEGNGEESQSFITVSATKQVREYEAVLVGKTEDGETDEHGKQILELINTSSFAQIGRSFTSGTSSHTRRVTKIIQKTFIRFLFPALSLWKVSRTVVIGRFSGYSIFVGQRSVLRIIPANP